MIDMSLAIQRSPITGYILYSLPSVYEDCKGTGWSPEINFLSKGMML